MVKQFLCKRNLGVQFLQKYSYNFLSLSRCSSVGRALVLGTRGRRVVAGYLDNLKGVYTVGGSGTDCRSVVEKLGWFDPINSHNKVDPKGVVRALEKREVVKIGVGVRVRHLPQVL